MFPVLLKNKSFPIIFIVTAFIIAIIANGFALTHDLKVIEGYKRLMPFQGIGYRHAGLNEYLPPGTKYVGYYTGQKIGYGKDSKYFAQAQYMLAPLILDHDNLDRDFIIFSCDERIAYQKIKELNLIPLRRNKFGIILAGKNHANIP